MTNWWWLWCGWGCRNGPGWCNRHCPLIRCSWMWHPLLADLASMKTNEMQTPLIKFPFVSAFLLPFTQVSPLYFFLHFFDTVKFPGHTKIITRPEETSETGVFNVSICLHKLRGEIAARRRLNVFIKNHDAQQNALNERSLKGIANRDSLGLSLVFGVELPSLHRLPRA